MAALGLHRCVCAFSSCARGSAPQQCVGSSLRGPLLQSIGSRLQRLDSCAWALWPYGMWNLRRSGIEPVFLAFPPGKSGRTFEIQVGKLWDLHVCLDVCVSVCMLWMWCVSTSGWYYQHEFVKELYLIGLKVISYRVLSWWVVSNSLRPHGLYVARQAPLSMVFSRQEYRSELPFPSPGDLPNQGSNLDLLHCRRILCCLSPQGSPSSYITQLSKN